MGLRGAAPSRRTPTQSEPRTTMSGGECRSRPWKSSLNLSLPIAAPVGEIADTTKRSVRRRRRLTRAHRSVTVAALICEIFDLRFSIFDFFIQQKIDRLASEPSKYFSQF